MHACPCIFAQDASPRLSLLTEGPGKNAIEPWSLKYLKILRKVKSCHNSYGAHARNSIASPSQPGGCSMGFSPVTVGYGIEPTKLLTAKELTKRSADHEARLQPGETLPRARRRLISRGALEPRER
eukprot:6177093-Pleurochrysis_carterae.AAC.3